MRDEYEDGGVNMGRLSEMNRDGTGGYGLSFGYLSCPTKEKNIFSSSALTSSGDNADIGQHHCKHYYILNADQYASSRALCR